MAGGYSDLGQSIILGIQDCLKKVFKKNPAYYSRFLLGGFSNNPVDDESELQDDYERSLYKVLRWATDHDVFYIDKSILYEENMVSELVDATDGYDDDTGSFLRYQFPSPFFGSLPLDDIIPNVVVPSYSWSKPHDAGKFGSFLVNRLASREKGFYVGAGCWHIYMEGDDLIYKFIGSIFNPPYGNELKINAYRSEGSDFKDVREFSDKLVNGYLAKLSTPVADIFLLTNDHEVFQNKYIVRKNSSGEYVMTIY